MRAFVGVTDTAWYRFLADRPELTEVNFWQPSGRRVFRALQLGEPFLFKTKAPGNRIVGGGFFSGHVTMRYRDAWEIFGQGNGVETLDQLRASVKRLRHSALPIDVNEEIGCVMLRDVSFFRPEEQPAAPTDWSKNIVQGKSYEVAGHSEIESTLAMLLAQSAARNVSGPMFGDAQLITPRLGQRPFKAMVLEAYHERCAVTGAKIRPVLEAAHIRPVSSGGQHRLDNGLLLRSDVHTLFDRGYLGVDPSLRLHVSTRLRSEFSNGDQFYALAGRSLPNIPDRRVDRPASEFLEWHLDEVFLAS